MSRTRDSYSCFYDQATNSVFALGGHRPDGVLKSTEKWIIGADSWEMASDLPDYAKHTAAVSSNSNEYVGYMVGGVTTSNNQVYTSKVWALKRSDMQWVQLESKSLQNKRRTHSLVNIGSTSAIPGC